MHLLHSSNPAQLDNVPPRAVDLAIGTPQLELLRAVADAIDYGVIVVTTDSTIRYCNRAARRELEKPGALTVWQGQIRASDPADAQLLVSSIRQASLYRLRRLVALHDRDSLSIAVNPIAMGEEGGGGALLLLGRREICAPLSADGFARQYGLTSAECGVLLALSGGHPPRCIADRHGVAISTIRTHIQNIRAKTGARGIAELISRVAALPPLMSVLEP